MSANTLVRLRLGWAFFAVTKPSSPFSRRSKKPCRVNSGLWRICQLQKCKYIAHHTK